MIAYASRTGNVEHIVHHLGLPNIKITNEIQLNEPFLLFTYTDGLGEIPQIVKNFLKENYQYCKGVIASGNSNFGHSVFCKSADTIHEKYNIPIVRKIELRGFQHDFEAIIDYYHNVFRREVSK